MEENWYNNYIISANRKRGKNHESKKKKRNHDYYSGCVYCAGCRGGWYVW